LKLPVLFRIAAFSVLLGFGAAAMATASDTDVPAEAARTIADIKVLLASQKSDPKRLDELQAIYKASAPETTDKKDLARYYRKKAEAAEELADERGALAAMEQVVSLGGAADLNNDLEYLSSLQERVSNISGAIDTTLRRIEMANREANSCMYRRLVNLYAQIDIVEAERAQSISEGQYQLNTDGAKWHKSGKKSKTTSLVSRSIRKRDVSKADALRFWKPVANALKPKLHFASRLTN
jgi:hypothetical protein